MQLIDSHAHLDHEKYDGQVDDTIARAEAAGVGQIICIASDLASTERSISLARNHAKLFASAGIHPHEASAASDGDMAQVGKLAEDPVVVAVGETGLDYHYDFSPRQLQLEVFAANIELSLAVGKPLVIHVREAHDDALKTLESFVPKGAGGVIHCFTGDRDQAEAYVALGYYISFSGILTFRNAESIREAAAWVPADRFLVETDSPYLAPMPHRGKRNEPAFVVHTANKLAEVRGVSFDEVALQSVENTRRLFGLPETGQVR